MTAYMFEGLTSEVNIRYYVEFDYIINILNLILMLFVARNDEHFNIMLILKVSKSFQLLNETKFLKMYVE